MADAKRGRPRKLHEQIVVTEKTEAGDDIEVVRPLGEVLVSMIDTGVKPELACEYVNVDKTSYYDWQRRGRDAAALLAQGVDVPADEQDFLDFLHALQRARGGMQRRLEQRLADLIPTMEPREVTDVLARLDKVKWAKASSMKLDVSGEINVVEHHGDAVAILIRLIVDGLLAKRTITEARASAQEIVQAALAAVVNRDDGGPPQLGAG